MAKSKCLSKDFITAPIKISLQPLHTNSQKNRCKENILRQSTYPHILSQSVDDGSMITHECSLFPSKHDFSCTQSTMKSASTLALPNVSDLFSGISKILASMMQEDDTYDDEFCLDLFEKKPTCTDVYNCLINLHRIGRWSEECYIITLVIINRILCHGNMILHSRNWKSLLICALMLAHKSWDDRTLKNIDFLVFWQRIFNGRNMPRMDKFNFMEVQILKIIDYNVFVTPRLYAKYYFALRSLTSAHEARDSRQNSILESQCKATYIALMDITLSMRCARAKSLA